MSQQDKSLESAKPRWRWFVAKRFDRQRHWVISTDAEDDDLDEALREQGFDPATRREGHDREPPPDGREDTSLEGRRWVRIMADVCTDCVSNIAGEACLADDLPVSDGLRQRMYAWQDWYDRDDDEEDGPFDRKAFAAEGLAIARAVKTELPDWTVFYVDESKLHEHAYACAIRIMPRSVYEYEIPPPETAG